MIIQRLIAGAALAAFAAAPAFAQAPAAQPAAPAAPEVAQQTVIAPAPGQSIAAELKASGQFTILLKAMDATNLTSMLASNPHLTLFAPTDAAFNALPPGQLDEMMKPANLKPLQEALAYHLINVVLTPGEVRGHAATPIASIAGPKVTIDGSADPIRVNDATVIQAGARASNGVIYVIDKVLNPAWTPAPAAPAEPAAPHG